MRELGSSFLIALHMGTTLKQVSDIATKMIIRNSPLFSCLQPDKSLEIYKAVKKFSRT